MLQNPTKPQNKQIIVNTIYLFFFTLNKSKIPIIRFSTTNSSDNKAAQGLKNAEQATSPSSSDKQSNQAFYVQPQTRVRQKRQMHTYPPTSTMSKAGITTHTFHETCGSFNQNSPPGIHAVDSRLSLLERNQRKSQARKYKNNRAKIRQ